MRERKVLVLDEHDEELVGLLTRLGLTKNTARTMTYLFNIAEATSHDIEIGAGLRQPEVSVAIGDLRERAWINERTIRTEGKGRPCKSYTLAVGVDEMINYMEGQKVRELNGHREALDRLKRFTETF